MKPAPKSWTASVATSPAVPSRRIERVNGPERARRGFCLQKNPQTLVESTRSPGLLSGFFCKKNPRTLPKSTRNPGPLSLSRRRRGSYGGAQLGEVALAPDHGEADPPPGAARRGPGPQPWQGEVPSATGAAARWPRRGCSPARARLDGPSAHGGSTGASGCSPGATALGRGGLQRRRGLQRRANLRYQRGAAAVDSHRAIVALLGSATGERSPSSCSLISNSL